MNKTEQFHWTLLSRPRWKAILSFLFAFGVFLFFARSLITAPSHILVIAAITLGHALLYDLCRLFFLQPFIVRMPGIVLAVSGIIVAVLLALLSQWLCRILGLPEIISRPITFAVVLAVGGAIGTNSAASRKLQ